MKVALLGGFDPQVASAGGVRAYVEALSGYLDEVGIAHFTILSGPSWVNRGDSCTVPVRRAGSTAHWLAALMSNMGRLSVSDDSIVHAQRPDELLPFLLSGTGKAWVCTIHGNPFQGISEKYGRAASAVYAVIEDLALRRANQVIFVDSENASKYLNRFPWLHGRLNVIPNGVDTNMFRPLDATTQKKKWGFDGVVFLYAGRLQPEKRVAEIVRAFRTLDKHGCTLVVAGAGSERAAIEDEAAGTNVRLIGPVPRREMPSLLNASDATVLFSTREGLPSIALEALACGVPLITTPVGSLPGVVREGETGFLVSTLTQLTEAMRRIRSGELPASPAMRKTVLRYSWTELGPRVMEVYSRADRTDSAK